MAAEQKCSNCFLSTLQTKVNGIFGYDQDLVHEFSSLTASCGASNYPTTSLLPLTMTLPTSTKHIGGPTTTVAPIPTDVAVGTNTQCAKYYRVRPGVNCNRISVVLGISLEDFYSLNPEVNSTDCNNLMPGNSYCVRAVSSSTTYSGYGGTTSRECIANGCVLPSRAVSSTTNTPSTTVITTTGIATPTPVQPRMVSGCTDFLLVPENVGCYPIANHKNIFLSDIFAWNRAVGEYCRGLRAGYYICVGVDSSPTTTITTTITTATPTGNGITDSVWDKNAEQRPLFRETPRSMI